MQSAQGEPLRAEILLLEATPTELQGLQASLAPAEAFRAAGLDYNPALAGARVSRVTLPDGRPVLQVITDGPVQAAFLDLLLVADWPGGRSTRIHTALLNAPAARAVTSQTLASTDLSGQPVVVKPGDTASRIAQQNLEAGISLDQMLLALLQANPSAFIGNDIHRLRAGAVLHLPNAEQAVRVAPAEARRMLRASSRDFGSYRSQLAEQAAPQVVPQASRAAAGKVEARVEDRLSTTDSPDRLTLSQATPSSPTDTNAQASLEQQSRETAERLAEVSRSLDELSQTQVAASATTRAPGSAEAPQTRASAAGLEASVGRVQPLATGASSGASAPSWGGLIDRLLSEPLVPWLAAGLAVFMATLAGLRIRQRRANPQPVPTDIHPSSTVRSGSVGESEPAREPAPPSSVAGTVGAALAPTDQASMAADGVKSPQGPNARFDDFLAAASAVNAARTQPPPRGEANEADIATVQAVLDVELDDEAGTAPGQAPPAFDFGSLSLDLEPPLADTVNEKAGPFASDEADPSTNKLELAIEFRAMGDIDAARLLLNEVLADASADAAVHARAQRLRSELG